MPEKTLSQVAKGIIWIGSSFEDLLTFPAAARQDAGYQLHRIQNGLDPENWKPFSEKTQQTSKSNKQIAIARYQAIIQQRRDPK